MIRRLEDMPAGTLGFEAVDEVAAAGFEEVLAPAVREAQATDREGIDAFAWLMPVEVRSFAPADLDAAEAWVAA
jgi:hypothetical protein